MTPRERNGSRCGFERDWRVRRHQHWSVHWSANYLNHNRDQYEQRRARLQQTGTRSAHLTIQSIGIKFSDWSLDWLHNRANDLISEVQSVEVDGIIFENLDYIRENIANGSSSSSGPTRSSWKSWSTRSNPQRCSWTS